MRFDIITIFIVLTALLISQAKVKVPYRLFLTRPMFLTRYISNSTSLMTTFKMSFENASF